MAETQRRSVRTSVPKLRIIYIFAAHSALLDYGIWQEDVTTDNLLIDENEKVKVVDFETEEIFDVDTKTTPTYVKREKEHLRHKCDRVKRDGNTNRWYEPTDVEVDASEVEKEGIVEGNEENGRRLSSKAKECSYFTDNAEVTTSL